MKEPEHFSFIDGLTTFIFYITLVASVVYYGKDTKNCSLNEKKFYLLDAQQKSNYVNIFSRFAPLSSSKAPFYVYVIAYIKENSPKDISFHFKYNYTADFWLDKRFQKNINDTGIDVSFDFKKDETRSEFVEIFHDTFTNVDAIDFNIIFEGDNNAIHGFDVNIYSAYASSHQFFFSISKITIACAVLSIIKHIRIHSVIEKIIHILVDILVIISTNPLSGIINIMNDGVFFKLSFFIFMSLGRIFIALRTIYMASIRNLTITISVLLLPFLVVLYEYLTYIESQSTAFVSYYRVFDASLVGALVLEIAYSVVLFYTLAINTCTNETLPKEKAFDIVIISTNQILSIIAKCMDCMNTQELSYVANLLFFISNVIGVIIINYSGIYEDGVEKINVNNDTNQLLAEHNAIEEEDDSQELAYINNIVGENE